MTCVGVCVSDMLLLVVVDLDGSVVGHTKGDDLGLVTRLGGCGGGLAIRAIRKGVA